MFQLSKHESWMEASLIVNELFLNYWNLIIFRWIELEFDYINFEPNLNQTQTYYINKRIEVELGSIRLGSVRFYYSLLTNLHSSTAKKPSVLKPRYPPYLQSPNTNVGDDNRKYWWQNRNLRGLRESPRSAFSSLGTASITSLQTVPETKLGNIWWWSSLRDWTMWRWTSKTVISNLRHYA